MAKGLRSAGSVELHRSVGADSCVGLPTGSAAMGIVDRARCWLAKDIRLEALQKRWQQLETSLFAKAAAQKLGCEKALRGNSAEARTMRALDAEIEMGFRDLAIEAGQILSMKASTLAAALAKVELGLRLQGPFDWRDHARELIESGLGEARTMTNCPGLADKLSD